MPPPRKRRPPGTPGSVVKKPKFTKTPPPPRTNDGSAELDIAALYETLVVTATPDRRADRVSLAQVWNKLKSLYHDNDKKDDKDDDNKAQTTSNNNYVWMQACEVFAVLLTRDSSSTSSSSLEDCIDDAAVMTKLLETMLHPMSPNADNDTSVGYWRNLATMIRCCNTVWTQAQTNPALHSAILKHHVGARLSLWQHMPERRRLLELKQRNWELDYDKATSSNKITSTPLIVATVQQLLRLLHSSQLVRLNATTDADTEDDADSADLQLQQWIFVHCALEFLLDVLSTTRSHRHVSVYLESLHFVRQCRAAIGTAQYSRAHEHLFLAQQLLDRLDQRLKQYPVVVVASSAAADSDEYGTLSATEQQALHHARASSLQKLCHRYYAELVPDLIYAGVGLLCQSTVFLKNALGGLQDSQLVELLHKMRLVDSTTGHAELYSRDFLLSILQDYIVMPHSAVQELVSFPLYPTKRVLWDWTKIPPSLSSLLPASGVLSLPKLSSARFLSFLDYLTRNFELTRLETAYEIRADLVDTIRRMRPVVRQRMEEDDNFNPVTKFSTEFTGWARMAVELTHVDNNDSKFKILKVAKPLLGQLYPEDVIAEIAIDLKQCSDSLRREWDSLGEHDIIFLVSIDASKMTGSPAPLLSEYHLRHGTHHRWDSDKDRRIPDEDDATFPDRFGVTLVRGCMILQVRDDSGNVLGEHGSGAPAGTKRIFKVALDPSQFIHDKNSPMGTAIYDSVNLVVRRKGAENNFKAVLETIRGLMVGVGSIDRVIPPWLQAVILGHGDPALASYNSKTMKEYAERTAGVAKPNAPLDFGDTFVSEAHLCDSFDGYRVVVDGHVNTDQSPSETSESRKNYRIRFVESDEEKTAQAESYAFQDGRVGNAVPFTSVQVEAIRSGLSPGLSVIVGPPGTGKTDVAVQIIASLYHSFPSQRTIIITHSNAALNDIFQKVTARGDVDERYLLRLGAGERDLQVDSTHDFTKTGRVAYSLNRRNLLLEQVQQLSESLGLSGRAERGVDGSPSYTCETAAYFFENHVTKRIRSFDRQVSALAEEESDISSFFPFATYFSLTESTVTINEARANFDKLKELFDELAEYRPLELLRNQRQRTDYLLLHQARVVAMTCTHAAIARSHLMELGFQYDNVVIEEAGQMTEIETFIPLLLQKGEAGGQSSRLKRVCLMGDHNQLPPVIKNMTFATYSSLDQSMFSRLIKLGVAYIQLDKQGRARPEIAALYSWRYKNLGNLALVSDATEFTAANAGFAYPFQLIDVPEFQGKGESAPTPYFFQNVGEAEYAVALFQYMVLIGYSAESISILTTYNGQKELISDILSQRCGPGTPLAGIRPLAVSTVDQYQGQQNNYVILSLVRTEKVGHLRDIRRLVVAVSRARLGLYVLCRQELFASHYDLKRTFDQFAGMPNKLQLVTGENYPTDRKVDDPLAEKRVYEVDDATDLGNVVYQMQEDLVVQDE